MNSINLKIGEAPCRNCSDRYVGCHGKCKEYLKWKEANKIERGRISAIKHHESTMYDVKIKGMENIKTKRSKYTVVTTHMK